MQHTAQPKLSQAETDYLSGKWVPSYYGLKFVVAQRKSDPHASEQDTSVKYATLGEAVAECNRRNAAKVVAYKSEPAHY